MKWTEVWEERQDELPNEFLSESEFDSLAREYVKRPLKVHALQIYSPFTVKTKEGLMRGKALDYLVRGIEGELYPVDAAIFEASYSATCTDPDAVHEWFELSYAQYLTVPRSVLQSMPPEWQARFVRCMQELDEAIDWRPKEGRYWVQLKDAKGRYVADPLMDYNKGRRRVR